MMLRPRGALVENDGRENQHLRERERRRMRSWDEIRTRVEKLQEQGRFRLQQVFTDEDIHQTCELLNIRFRDRIFPPATTLNLFVAQVLSRGDACVTVLANFNRERKQQGLPPVSEDAAAYTKARARLTVELIDHLSRRIHGIARDRTPTEWKWHGMDVYLVDGLVLRAPDTAANQSRYPQPSSQEPGLGFPQVRVVVTTSLATGCAVHYSTAPVQGKQTGEVSLFREQHGEFAAGDLIVTDSNFESFHDAALLRRRGLHLVCAINSARTPPFEGRCEAIEERLLELRKPQFDPSRFTLEAWRDLPERVPVRAIRFPLAGSDRSLTIMTTLTDSQEFSARDIAELYGLRWDVEVDIRSYKTTLGMWELRCLNPDNLEREIAVSMLAYNLVRLVMCDTAEVLEVHPRDISFSQARDAWHAFGDELAGSEDIAWLVHSAGGRLVRNRPGRQEPRAVKRRHAKYPRLKTPRPSRQRKSRLPREPPKASPCHSP